jgi:hypothetical protein
MRLKRKRLRLRALRKSRELTTFSNRTAAIKPRDILVFMTGCCVATGTTTGA